MASHLSQPNGNAFASFEMFFLYSKSFFRMVFCFHHLSFVKGTCFFVFFCICILPGDTHVRSSVPAASQNGLANLWHQANCMLRGA